MKNKKILNTVLGFGAICVIAFSSAFAYLTDNESDYTNFAVRHVTVDLVEGGMYNKDEEDGGGLEYGETYEYVRDERVHNIGVTPYAHNSGSIDAVVFMEVVVPLIDRDSIDDEEDPPVRVGYEDKADAFSFTFGDDDKNEIFYYGDDLGDESADRYSWDVRPSFNGTVWWGNWILLDSKYYIETDGAVSCGYLYGYSEKIYEGNKTLPLFDWLRVTNFATSTDGENLKLPIRLYAIQADFLDKNVQGMNKDDLQSILNTYINQDPTSFHNLELKDANTTGRYDAGGADLY